MMKSVLVVIEFLLKKSESEAITSQDYQNKKGRDFGRGLPMITR
jgi:hypothetical protein